MVVLAVGTMVSEVKAQTIKITELHFPPFALYKNFISVDFTISFTGARSGDIVVAAVRDSVTEMPLRGLGCSELGAYSLASCPYVIFVSSGNLEVGFSLGDPISGFHYAPGTYHLTAGATLNTAGRSISDSIDFTLVIKDKAGLSIEVPGTVSATIDGVAYPEGPVTVEVTPGPHRISVPSSVESDDVRLRFDHWSNGETSPDITVTLQSPQVGLAAHYITQYRLTIVGEGDAEGAGWYDEGTSATFSVTSPVRLMPGFLGIVGGKLRFQGWYEDDALVTNSLTGQRKMDAPLVLNVRWDHDYAIPLALLAISILTTVAICYLCRGRTKDKI